MTTHTNTDTDKALHTKTLAELSRGLANKAFSSTELTQHFLSRIKKLDPQLNSFITVTEQLALTQAKQADQRIASNNATPLTGIPIAQKDIFCTQGIKTSCASRMLDNFIAPYNATLIDQLNQAGTVMLGKTNMDEFAMGSSNENSYYGAVKNPWNQHHTPGGSSGGSAAAVAARITPVATGTDTGGSIRQPSSYCGITGLKPTYGRVSRYGMVAFASSLDQAGPMAQTAEDAAMLLQAMAGFDPKDSTSVNEPVPDYMSAINDSIRGLRIGLPKGYFKDLDPVIGDLIQDNLRKIQPLGVSIKDITLPNSHLAIPVYYVISMAEAASNLARYDGVRYGYRCDNPKDLLDLYCRTRSEGFGLEVKRRIMMGNFVLSGGYYDAYYSKAKQIRRLISQDHQQAFKDVDIILGPTTPNIACKLNERINDPISMYLLDIYTAPASLSGLPCLSLPGGFINGLPIGIQLIGNYFTEAKLLNLAHQFQQVTDWHKTMPTLISEGD